MGSVSRAQLTGAGRPGRTGLHRDWESEPQRALKGYQVRRFGKYLALAQWKVCVRTPTQGDRDDAVLLAWQLSSLGSLATTVREVDVGKGVEEVVQVAGL